VGRSSYSDRDDNSGRDNGKQRSASFLVLFLQALYRTVLSRNVLGLLCGTQQIVEEKEVTSWRVRRYSGNQMIQFVYMSKFIDH